MARDYKKAFEKDNTSNQVSIQSDQPEQPNTIEITEYQLIKFRRMPSETQDQMWNTVLKNAFNLSYPGPDGNYKEYDPLRPLAVVLEALRREGTKLIRMKSKDVKTEIEYEHYKLDRGNIPAEKWRELTGGLAGFKDKLMWLFTVSILGVTTQEGVEIAEGLFKEWVFKNDPERAAKQWGGQQWEEGSLELKGGTN